MTMGSVSSQTTVGRYGRAASRRAARRTLARLLGAGVAGLLAVTVAGCRAVSRDGPAGDGAAGSAAATAGPAVTPEQALKIFKANYELRIRANRAERVDRTGERHLPAAETGLALALDRARFRNLRLRGETPSALWRVPRARVYVPRGPAGWFAAVYPEGKGYGTAILTRTSGGWKVSTSAWSETEPPEAALDADGYATALAPDRLGGLRVSPRQVAAAYARYRRYAGAGQGDLFADGPYTSRFAEDVRADGRDLKGLYAFRFTDTPDGTVHALRAADGGALAWHGLTEVQTLTRLDRLAELGIKDPTIAALAGTRRLAGNLTVTARGAYLTHIPAASSGGSARVLGEWYEYTSAKVR